MHFRNINTKNQPDATTYFLDSGVKVQKDATRDSLFIWAEKLQNNIVKTKKYFGSGVLEGGSPRIVDRDSTTYFISSSKIIITGGSYGSGYMSIGRSTDLGQTFEHIETRVTITGTEIPAMDFYIDLSVTNIENAEEGQVLGFETTSYINRSDDYGKTWYRWDDGSGANSRPSTSILALLLLSNDTILGHFHDLAAPPTGENLHESRDYGKTWAAVDTTGIKYTVDGYIFCLRELSDGSLLAGMSDQSLQDDGIYRSTDKGVFWLPSTAGVGATKHRWIDMFECEQDGTVVGCVYDFDLYKPEFYQSGDYGENWTNTYEYEPAGDVINGGVQCGAGTDVVIFYGRDISENIGVYYRTTDAGLTWTRYTVDGSYDFKSGVWCGEYVFLFSETHSTGQQPYCWRSSNKGISFTKMSQAVAFQGNIDERGQSICLDTPASWCVKRDEFGRVEADEGSSQTIQTPRVNTEEIYFSNSIRGLISGENVTYDSTDRFHITGSGWESANATKILSAVPDVGDSFQHRPGFSPPVFDGRYVYIMGNTIWMKYDTQKSKYYSWDSKEIDGLYYDAHRDISQIENPYAWEWIYYSSIVGWGQPTVYYDGPHSGAVKEGNWIYFAPYNNQSIWRMRICDHLEFKDSSIWESVSASSVQGGSKASPYYYYRGICSDGQYIYFSPYNSESLLRFNHGRATANGIDLSDTYQDSSRAEYWEVISISKAVEGGGGIRETNQFAGVIHHNGYVYYAPYGYNSKSKSGQKGFLRFAEDMCQRNEFYFDDATCWSFISFYDAWGERPAAQSSGMFRGIVKRGAYLYFTPSGSESFIRWSWSSTWDSTTGWEFAPITEIFSDLCSGGSFSDPKYVENPCQDGQYVYYSPGRSHVYVRFDSTKAFDLATSWEYIGGSEILYDTDKDPASNTKFESWGAAGACEAGNYIYFSPRYLVQKNVGGSHITPYMKMLRFHKDKKFNRAQNQVDYIWLDNEDDFHETKLQYLSNSWSPSYNTSREYEEVPDSTMSLLLWAVRHDDEQRRIDSIRDMRVVIPEMRIGFDRTHWKGYVTDESQFPKTGNRNGDMLVLLKEGSTDTRTLWVWYTPITPGIEGHWHPVYPEGAAKYGFRDIQFLGKGNEFRGLEGANKPHGKARFTQGINIAFDDVSGTYGNRSIELNVRIRDDLDMNGHNIINASNIDTTGDLLLNGLIRVDGTTIIYGNIDATTVTFNTSAKIGRMVVEKGIFRGHNVVTNYLTVVEENLLVEERMDTTGALTVTGTINGVTIQDHHARHEIGGEDQIDATHLAGIMATTQNCAWIQEYDVSPDTPEDDDVLQYLGGEWTPEPFQTEYELSFEQRMALHRMGMNPDAAQSDWMRELLYRSSKVDDYYSWEEVDLGTMFSLDNDPGGWRPGNVYNGACFDGKYIYYTPFDSTTFVRYDTDEGFTERNAWQHWKTYFIRKNETDGGDFHLFAGNACFDGKFVYYAPYNSKTFVRFNTQGRRKGQSENDLEEDFSFNVRQNWDTCDQTRSGLALMRTGVDEYREVEKAFVSCVFDGRWVYYIPYRSRTAVRFDTASREAGQTLTSDGKFNNGLNWETVSMEWILGIRPGGYPDDDNLFSEGTFDGKWVYFGSSESKTFVRFNTRSLYAGDSGWAGKAMRLTGFRDRTSWDTVSIQAVLRHRMPDLGHYFPVITNCGRFVYYAPDSTACAYDDSMPAITQVDSTTMIRYKIGEPFDDPNSWEKIEIDRILKGKTGWHDRAFGSAIFDGLWVYFAPEKAEWVLRYNTDKYFQDTTSWEYISASDARFVGGYLGKSQGASFDGEYVYFGPSRNPYCCRFKGLQCGGSYGMH